MLWTVFMLSMFIWMAVLVLQYRMGAMPIMIVLATILGFIKVFRRSSTGSGRRAESAHPGLNSCVLTAGELSHQTDRQKIIRRTKGA